MLESFYYTSILFKVTFLLYLVALLAYLAGAFKKGKIFGIIAVALFGIAFLASGTKQPFWERDECVPSFVILPIAAD